VAFVWIGELLDKEDAAQCSTMQAALQQPRTIGQSCRFSTAQIKAILRGIRRTLRWLHLVYDSIPTRAHSNTLVMLMKPLNHHEASCCWVAILQPTNALILQNII